MTTPDQTVETSAAEANPAADAPPDPESPPDVETPACAPSVGSESDAVASTSAPAVDENSILPSAPPVTETPAFESEAVSTEDVTALAPVSPTSAAQTTPTDPASTPPIASVPALSSTQPVVASPEQPTDSPPEQPKAPAPTQPAVAGPEQPTLPAPEQPTASAPTLPAVAATAQPKDPALEQPAVLAPTLPTAAAPAQLKDPPPIQTQPSTDPAPTQATALAPALSTDQPPAEPEASEPSTQPTAAAPMPSAASAVTNPTVSAPTQLIAASAPTNPIAAAPTQPAVPAAQPPTPSVPASEPLDEPMPDEPMPEEPMPELQFSNASVLAPSVPPVTTRRPPVPGPAASKSKKKKAPAPVVTMATAPVAQPSALGDQGENTGRWTSEEHRLFLQGLDQHGKGWKKIASLIKSRTVVQIRTHAQKYFQKLSKARQNGEEGDVTMEGRGGVASVTSVSSAAAAQSGKRRRPTTGTKRKAIHSVVASAQREGKRLAAAQGNAGVIDHVPPLPAVAPILAYFVLPYASDVPATSSTGNCVPSFTATQGNISGPALEDSLFRFLTPMPIAPMEPTQVNDVARQAGANPITLPTENPDCSPMVGGGEISPTGVFDLDLYPTWPDNRDPPSWYAKGSDIDALLDVGGSLDWLEDTGDLHESYEPPVGDPGLGMPRFDSSKGVAELGQTGTRNSTSVSTLPHVDSSVGSVVPPLPSLFEGAPSSQSLHQMHHVNASMSSTKLNESTSATGMDEHLQVFDTPMEEDDFVSTILENANESSDSFHALS